MPRTLKLQHFTLIISTMAGYSLHSIIATVGLSLEHRALYPTLQDQLLLQTQDPPWWKMAFM